ncbi:MAG: hypothetical protein CMO55_01420 [Verrucomicrobiales bacterium]|nr:hypothetical protein [Verrucomicrobiales bacterium]
MNHSSDTFEELTSLASRMLDDGLPPEDLTRLTELISNSEDAHRHFVTLCELHSMLEAEPVIQDALASSARPFNVVSLPGSKSVASDSDEELPVTKSVPLRPLAWLTAAAAVVVATLFLLYSSDTNPSQTFDSAENVANIEKTESATDPTNTNSDDEEPQKQYERAVLATLGSGSQQRPPTNFSVEPSLADDEISYNRHIRPILSDNCFSCHGPDEAGRKAKLRLDTPDGAKTGESPAIVAGDTDASELVARILSQDEDEIMPPPDSHKSLTPAQINLLERWVGEGAEYEDHWAFMKIEKATPEDLDGHPIDYFVDKELARHSLTRSPEADPRTLVRRVYLDLTGLPPTPAEIDSYLEDSSEDKYAKLIDELMARPSFGEHRARYWLDAARYGDTHGLHLDNYREIWPYRDWVINAFNDNKPFDQFTVEQLAGDLIPEATQEQQIATGFNRCNVTTSEGGAIEEEFLVRYAVDRVSTTSTVWMGLTAGCAQCHDHKFDPMTMKDFYSLFAFFNNTTQPGMDGNAKDSPPVLRVYDSAEHEAAASELRKQIAEKLVASKKILSESKFSETKLAEVTPEFTNHGEESVPTNLGDGYNFSKSQPFTVSFRVRLPTTDGRTILAQAVDPENKNRGWRIYWEDRGILVELIEEYPNRLLKRGITRRFRPGSHVHFTVTYDGSGNGDGIRLFSGGKYQSSRFTNQWFDSLENDFKSENANLLVGGKDPQTGLNPRITEFIVFDRRLSDVEVETLALYSANLGVEKKEAEKRSEKEKQQLKAFLATFSKGPYQDTIHEMAELETQLQAVESASALSLVMAEKEGEAKAHMLMRGEYDQKAEEVTPAFPAFLPALDESLPMNRLGLAKWLVHPEHPLTARVSANRIWQELFGIGLVKTSEDFGTQGENPSHPELLDWLAATFIESGWDVKHLYRTILLSETYRQSSKTSETLAKRDPENRLLARGPRFRLDAEVIRDQALHASGLLKEKVGGPSVRPYQPAGIWEAVGYTNSNTQTFFQDFGAAAEHRRSIYSFWKRTAHPPNLAIFDAPNRESCVMRRERTNTPLQALVLMNDPQFVRTSRHLALRVLSEAEGRDNRLDRMAELLRGKPLTDNERKIVVNSLDQFRNIYESDTAAANELLVDEVNPTFTVKASQEHPAPELAAWTMVANQMLNLDEAINKN